MRKSNRLFVAIFNRSQQNFMKQYNELKIKEIVTYREKNIKK